MRKEKSQLPPSPFEEHYTCFLYSILKTSSFSPITFIIFKMIENIQINLYVLRLPLMDNWNKDFLNLSSSFTSYFSFEFLLGLNPSILFSKLVSLVLANIIVVGLMIALFLSAKKGEVESTWTKVSLYIVSVMLIGYRTFIQIPYFNAIILSFTIYDRPELLAVNPPLLCIILSIIGLIFFLAVQAFIIFGISDINPYSYVPYAGQTKFRKIFMFFYKLGFVLYSTIIDRDLVYQKQFLLILVIINFLWLVKCHTEPICYYNEKVNRSYFRVMYIVFWIYFSVMVFAYTKAQRSTLMNIYFMSYFSFSFQSYYERKKTETLITKNLEDIKQIKDKEAYIVELIKLIEQMDKKNEKIQFIGYLNNHKRLCVNEECNCHQIIFDSFQTVASLKDKGYKLLAEILTSWIKKEEQSKTLQLLLAYIYHYGHKKKFKSYYTVVELQSKTTFFERVQCYRHMKTIQTQLTYHIEKNEQVFPKGLNHFYQFNMLIIQFEKSLQKCTENHILFWKELLEDTINLERLTNIGAEITNEKDDLRKFFLKLNKLNPNNIHILILFGKFLEQISNDETENNQYLNMATEIYDKIIENQGNLTNKYGSNAETSIVIISGNQLELGKIVQTNNFVSQNFGYKKPELISNNITMVMPEIFQSLHNSFIENYLQTSKSLVIGKDRIVPVKKKNGYTQPSFLMIKTMPDLENGVRIAGFISPYIEEQDEENEKKQYSYLLYNTKNDKVLGICRNCDLKYDIGRQLLTNESHPLKTTEIFTGALESLFDASLDEQFLMVQLNTQIIYYKFLLDSHSSSQNRSDELNYLQKGKISNVAVKSIFSDVYNGIPLRIISFYNTQADFFTKIEAPQLFSIQQLSSCTQQIDDFSLMSEYQGSKQIKQFKRFISLQNQPSTITKIKNFCCIFILLITFGIGTLIYFWFMITQNYISFMTTNSHFLMCKISFVETMFEAEKIYINQNQQFVRGHQFSQNSTLSEMQFMISIGRSSEISLLPMKYKLIENYSEKFNEYYIKNDGTIHTSEGSADEVIAYTLTKAESLRKSDLSYLQENPLNFRLSLPQNYMELKYTTLFQILPGNERINEKVLKAEEDEAKLMQIYVLGIQGVMVVSFVLWIIISIPKILSVIKMSNKVMTMFTLIPEQYVHNIIQSCRQYEEIFLIESNIVSENNFKINNQNKNLFIKMFQQCDISNPEGKKNMKKTQKRERMIEESTSCQQRYDKFSFTRVFIVICAFLFMYLMFSFFYTSFMLDKNRQQFYLLTTISLKAAKLRQIKLTFTEFLMNPDLNGENNIKNITEGLIDEIYGIQRNLENITKNHDLCSIFEEINQNNICANISKLSKYHLYPFQPFQEDQCINIANGSLTKGIKTGIVLSLEEMRLYLLRNDTYWANHNREQALTESMEKYQTLFKYIEAALFMIIELIVVEKLVTLFSQRFYFIVISGSFFVLMILFWRTFWSISIEKLKKNIWRTKGMLNLIPTYIIKDNEVLQKQFNCEELQKIVK